MSDKRRSLVVAAVALVACCLGLPLLIGVIGSGALWAWLGDAAVPALVVLLIVGSLYLLLRRNLGRVAALKGDQSGGRDGGLDRWHDGLQ